MKKGIHLKCTNEQKRIVCYKKTMKKAIYSIVITFSPLVLLSLHLVFAQEQGDFELHLSRDFGYSSGAGKIQGTFTVSAIGTADLTLVSFYLDGQLMGEAGQLPFKLRFNTDNYPLGDHTIYATGQIRDGRQLRSNEIRVEFVSSEEGWQAVMRFTAPIFALTFGAIILSFVFMFLSAGKQRSLPPGAPRKYGISGGAICPKCGRPFPRHLFSTNLVTGKLERCPFCGKWNIVKAVSMVELCAAEKAELEVDRQSEIISLEDLRKELEDSRFQDL